MNTVDGCLIAIISQVLDFICIHGKGGLILFIRTTSNDAFAENMMSTTIEKKSQSFAEFYPFYLSQHSNRICRELHFIGSTLALACLATAVLISNAWWILAALFCGYGFAWVGHFGFEKNRPATFRQPLYSLMGDWVMYWQMLTGQVSF